MSKLELFLHDQPEPTPVLLKAALAHVQFETIHPFLDGNGRLGRAAASTRQVHRALMEHPIATSNWLVEKTGLTPATVNKALGHLEQLGIAKKLTARKRNRLFSYAGYIDLMNRGAELPAG